MPDGMRTTPTGSLLSSRRARDIFNAADHPSATGPAAFHGAMDRLDAQTEQLHAALLMLRDAWNAHMETCPQRLDLHPPTAEDIERWCNAPSNTASAS